MLERYLVEHCSPTLASIKTANLFNMPYASWKELDGQLESLKQQFAEKGISLSVVRKREGTALIYVYRRQKLKEDLTKPGVAEFLQTYGYENTDVDQAIERLHMRLEKGGNFPHEIGLFLGYPLGDVKGFIENAGKNSRCAGCWKVYCNECETMKLFERFRKCREIYLRLWQQGKPVWKLAVAA